MKLRNLLSILMLVTAASQLEADVLVKNMTTYPIKVRMHWYGGTLYGDPQEEAIWANDADKARGPVGTFKTSKDINPGQQEWISGELWNTKSRWQVKALTGAGTAVQDWKTVIDTPVSSAGNRVLTVYSRPDIKTGKEVWSFEDKLTTAGE